MLKIADRLFKSRLFVGTGKFSSHLEMRNAIISSGTELVTMALKRVNLDHRDDDILSNLKDLPVNWLPNTSGVRDAKEAVFASKMAREALETNWIKLEIHPDPKYLLPDSVETLKAAEQLVKDGFVVLPYINADPVLCKKLEDVGVQAVMPLGSPIGTNMGLKTRDMLEIIIEQSNVPVIVDAGIGLPSHASEAMEMGASAVLINTAIAVCSNPSQVAEAFKMAVEAGRISYENHNIRVSKMANPTSPVSIFLDDIEL
ncbi:thiazole synthase [Ichthyobacterium seriolicida]|uniref:Thiazole synthase n=1 Tax=Ichthyobacterium seriolicida TaxID=242600 RepID=A0A1J1DX23_9FLAO|nr:thiazole synthase [Ichthyobacterium seriolicida]BAV94410.1 thiazole biosynthesis protein thiG [Ichthyobacterium seriolicida]